jgi:ribosomal protein RSM22 (predicted rRNA methylase)
MRATDGDYRRHVTGSGPGSLAAAVEAGLAGTGVPSLSAGVRRLMTAYRSGEVPDAPVLASGADAAAYAAYRMPATAAATAQALRQLRACLPGWAPAALLDFGTGTGGAAWAAADQLPSVTSMTLLEQSAEAIRLGKAIFAAGVAPALSSASWRAWRLPADEELSSAGAGAASPDLPSADLATAAYVLGELTAAQQAALVALAARAAPAVLLVEPGTPAGHRRILAARAQLLAAGHVVAAPCPQQLGCPLDVDGDWCHFGARLQRSAVHRQAKGADLSYEDEKYSYVAAVRPGSAAGPAGPDVTLPLGRIVRRPQQRKGLVMLDLCWRDGAVRRELVAKSKGELYRQARKISWGDSWPPLAKDEGHDRDRDP